MRGKTVLWDAHVTAGMSLLGSVVAFIVALLIGGLAIFVSASIVKGKRDFGHAVITALLGAIAWAITSWIPLIGTVLALIAWVWVIKWRYRGSWMDAIIIGLVAWIAALLILYALDLGLDLDIRAFGIPGA